MLAERKRELIAQYGQNEQDTGSTAVQVALLTERIMELTKHLESNRHDFHSRRGLLKMVGQRRRLLGYLQSKNQTGYQDLIKSLGLRR